MNLYCIFVLLFICCQFVLSQKVVEECLSGKYPPKPSLRVQSYVVNLDLPPESRWNNVVTAKKSEILNLLVQFKKFLREFDSDSSILIHLVDNDLGYLVDSLPQPYQGEIRGIANVTEIPLGEIMLFNIFYEIFTVCTSIIAQDPSGKLFHARNLDFGLFLGWDSRNKTWEITKYLRRNIVEVDFQSGGRSQYKSVNYAGYVGLLTAVKKDKFTLTVNERFSINGGYIGILKWILLNDRKSKWMGFLTRDVLHQADSFDEALTSLSKQPMLAPVYFILGGRKAYQAAVITRSRKAAINVWMMNSTRQDWFLLETNYDHWVKPMFIDDRRTPGFKCMRHKGAKEAATFPGLFDVLSSRPMLNKLTTYTALMQVNSGTLETFLQTCDSDGCMPW